MSLSETIYSNREGAKKLNRQIKTSGTAKAAKNAKKSRIEKI